MTTKGQSLELFFIDGRPDGMLTAELFNWRGHVLVAPRTQIVAALKRTEASFTGVYLLIGEREDEALAYIGEAEDISKRMAQHIPNKDWWSRAIFISSSNNKLNKAHARYLEHRLIGRARSIGRHRLENGNSPSAPTISEADQANMETFLENLFIILPAIGVDMFVESKRKKPPTEPTDATSADAVRFILETQKHSIKATARLEDGDFIVETGSIVRKAWESQSATHAGYAGLRRELDRMGVIELQGDHGVFTDDYAFKSPSAAAAIVNGRPANGTLEWKVETTGQTYKEWEAAQLDKEISEFV